MRVRGGGGGSERKEVSFLITEETGWVEGPFNRRLTAKEWASRDNIFIINTGETTSTTPYSTVPSHSHSHTHICTERERERETNSVECLIEQRQTAARSHTSPVISDADSFDPH